MLGALTGLTTIGMMTALLVLYTGFLSHTSQYFGTQVELQNHENERLELMQYLKSEQRCADLVNHVYSDGSVMKGVSLPPALKDKSIFYGIEPHKGSDEANGNIIVKDSEKLTKVAVRFKGLLSTRTCTTIIEPDESLPTHTHSDHSG